MPPAPRSNLHSKRHLLSRPLFPREGHDGHPGERGRLFSGEHISPATSPREQDPSACAERRTPSACQRRLLVGYRAAVPQPHCLSPPGSFPKRQIPGPGLPRQIRTSVMGLSNLQVQRLLKGHPARLLTSVGAAIQSKGLGCFCTSPG